MANKQINLFVLLLVSLVLVPAFSSATTPVTIKSWCSQTPFPEPCEYFMADHNQHSLGIKSRADFDRALMQITLDRALKAESRTYGLGAQCRNEKEKVAWADCAELYLDTVMQLNRTAHPKSKCTNFDTQTWLSAALTNLETCRAGFIELGVSDFILPLMSNNVSKLVSNTLAINKLPPAQQVGAVDGEGYPSWVSPGVRKLLQSSPRANVVVAKDGSGNFATIKQAIDAASSRKGSERFVIYVKAGVYSENVVVDKKVKNVMLMGDGKGKTVITGSRSVQGGSTTFNSATVAVNGDGFIARGITFRNTAGPSNGQAVALRSGSDLSVFYSCSFEGYQDTLYVYSQRQFYRDCDVYGTVDFIFGNAAVVLQNCNIIARKPNQGQSITITAQGRSDPNQNTGISFHNCRVTATPDLKQSSTKTFLGRPWRPYSRTVFLKTFMDSLINPAGWLKWASEADLKTLYYGEYMNTGPGSSTANRVKWGGYHVMNAAEASKFTVGNFIAGSSWLPATNVPFSSGL
ncbi:hypothetical protein Sjap_020163 [Stephania japonica]|uniref:Pectinesterase n=1 Tax=Stephania japonica TaxID=461633 RepID=A0AAP0F955_9MAGN